MSRIFFLTFLCMFALNCNAEGIDTVFLGTATTQEYVSVKVSCPENSICMNVWFKWTLDVNRVISGPQIKGRVVAFRMEHASYTKA